MDEQGFALEMRLRSGFELAVDFGEDRVPGLTVDEAPPLGEGNGPSPARLLGAAVGSCMSASLLFCLRRARVEVPELRTTVEGTLVRNEAGRLRIGGLRVRLHPMVDPGDRARMERCLELFEDFCVVGQSVRQGIPLHVEVEPAPLAAGATTAP